MAEDGFPRPVSDIVATIADLFRQQNRAEIAELLECAHARFEQTDYDNWNGGTYSWALRLEVPVPVFAGVEAKLESIEKDVVAKLKHFHRALPNHNLSEVTIVPDSAATPRQGTRNTPPSADVARLWRPGRFRLFLSHLAVDRVAVSKIKEALAHRGVDAFVAHEDIEPSLQWQSEIELALRSMHALAALVTPAFHQSKWTDQEVGWALGRGIPVVPVRLGADPYGLFGKFQGVPGSFERPADLAVSLVAALLVNPSSTVEMRRSLVRAFQEADSFVEAIALKELLIKAKGFDDSEKAALHGACVENNQVVGAFGVVRAINRLIGESPKPSVRPKPDADEVPF